MDGLALPLGDIDRLPGNFAGPFRRASAQECPRMRPEDLHYEVAEGALGAAHAERLFSGRDGQVPLPIQSTGD